MQEIFEGTLAINSSIVRFVDYLSFKTLFQREIVSNFARKRRLFRLNFKIYGRLQLNFKININDEFREIGRKVNC